jgi:hypothetical protein
MSTPPVEHVHVARRRGVATLRVAGPDVADRRNGFAEQRVDEAGLPGSRLAQHRHRLVAGPVAQLVQTDALARRGDDHLDSGARGCNFSGDGFGVS